MCGVHVGMHVFACLWVNLFAYGCGSPRLISGIILFYVIPWGKKSLNWTQSSPTWPALRAVCSGDQILSDFLGWNYRQALHTSVTSWRSKLCSPGLHGKDSHVPGIWIWVWIWIYISGLCVKNICLCSSPHCSIGFLRQEAKGGWYCLSVWMLGLGVSQGPSGLTWVTVAMILWCLPSAGPASPVPPHTTAHRTQHPLGRKARGPTHRYRCYF